VKRWQSYSSICHSGKPHAANNFMIPCFIEQELLPIEVYIAGIGIFDLTGS